MNRGSIPRAGTQPQAARAVVALLAANSIAASVGACGIVRFDHDEGAVSAGGAGGAGGTTSCTDDCAQRCELVSDPESCDALAGCAWFAGACQPASHDPRFVGLWLVDQPCHALYEATYYELDATGALSVARSLGLEPGAQTGVVAPCPQTKPSMPCESELRCVFGERWHSVGPTQLYIEGVCSDGTTRAIHLGFTPEVQPVHACGGEGELLDVDGDPDWMHWGSEWSWRKCTPGTGPERCF